MKKYKHIVNYEIKEIEQSHPYDNSKNKEIFLEDFLNDLNLNKNDYSDVSNNKKNLFKIKYNGKNINIFIETPDGGGRDGKSKNNKNGKKISIPFNKAFKKAIEDFENVVVVDIYYQLKEPAEIEKPYDIDKSNFVYCFIDQQEIYKSESTHNLYENKNSNPTSRWVDLNDILISLKNKEIVQNKNKNVWIVPRQKLRSFFDEFLEKYDYYLDYKILELAKEFIEKTKDYKKTQTLRSCLFRRKLLNKNQKCEIKNCCISFEPDLIASHIRSVEDISKDKRISKGEKIKQIADENNGFIFCRNHDLLFDKHFITFDEEGKLIVSEEFKLYSNQFGLKNGENCVSLNDKKNIFLFFHREKFKKWLKN